MKNPFLPGDKKTLRFKVRHSDRPTFPTGTVHEVYSTFALIRDAEWTTRQFVLEMKEEDEEGIGTMVHVEHHAPALVGEHITITGELTAVHGHEIICRFEVRAGTRLIASGETGQKILKRIKFEKLFEALPE